MDWGILVYVAIGFLVVHILLDVRALIHSAWLWMNIKHEHDGALWKCARCGHREWRVDELKHTTLWTLAAVIALAGHLIFDFVG